MEMVKTIKNTNNSNIGQNSIIIEGEGLRKIKQYRGKNNNEIFEDTHLSFKESKLKIMKIIRKEGKPIKYPHSK